MSVMMTPRRLYEYSLAGGTVHKTWYQLTDEEREHWRWVSRCIVQDVAWDIAKIEKIDEDSLVSWIENTPRLVLLILYRQLNRMGFTVSNIDSQIRSEEAKLKKS